MGWIRRLRAAFGMRLPETPPAKGQPRLVLADPAEVIRFLQGQTDAARFSLAGRAVRNQFHLRRYGPRGWHEAQLRHLAAHPEIAAGFLFHSDGYIREAALNALDGPITLPVVVYGVMQRMNDWSPAVRAAARAAFARCLPQTAPEVLEPAVWVGLVNARTWGRWQGGYDDLVAQIAGYPALFKALIMVLVHESRAKSSGVFQSLCRSPEMDGFLEQIAGLAREPHLRAAALYSIVAGKVIWPTGQMQKIWVDKSMGESRLAAQYDSRPLSVDLGRVAALRIGLGDRSFVVVKEALDALTLCRDDPDLRGLISDSLERFADTQRPALRRRLDYLAQVLSGPD